MTNTYIGIDNGVSGGAVAIGRLGHYIAGIRMPVVQREFNWMEIVKKRYRLATANEIDAPMLVAWINSVTHGQPFAIAIEECPKHAKQKSTMRSMGISYGILLGAITAAFPDAELHIVRSGNPRDSWQRAMLGRVAQGGTKEAALAKARELWSDETFFATARSKTPHTGIVDAALIANYIRFKTTE